jgi:hypothetical protein
MDHFSVQMQFTVHVLAEKSGITESQHNIYVSCSEYDFVMAIAGCKKCMEQHSTVVSGFDDG